MPLQFPNFSAAAAYLRTLLNLRTLEPDVATLARGLVDVNGNIYEYLDPNGIPAISPARGDGGGLIGLKVAKAVYDTATNDSSGASNLAIGAHGLGVTIPNTAVIVGGFVRVDTLFTTGASGTIALSAQTANDIISATIASGAPYSTTGLKAIVPKANTPESTGIALTAAREITATVATGALTAGKLTAFIYYVL